MVAEQTQSVSAVLDKIRTRGYWWVVIHPGDFRDDRVPYPDLLPLVENAAVRLRGEPFPSVGGNPVRFSGQWVDHETDTSHVVEYWRMYQSGQFVGYKGLRSDWLEQSSLYPAWPGWQPGQFLSIEDAILSVTEIFEFAARLALSAPYRASINTHVALTLLGMGGRTLVSTSGRELHGQYTATIDEYPQTYTLMREKFIADAKPLAAQATREIFARFGWNALPEIVRDLQSRSAR